MMMLMRFPHDRAAIVSRAGAGLVLVDALKPGRGDSFDGKVGRAGRVFSELMPGILRVRPTLR